MTILSNNLKVIRKNLNHTQTSLAKVLDIGFRSYVRYEAGERDAPVSVIVKMARLGNISLDHLLTTKVLPEDLKTPDQKDFPTSNTPIEVIGGNFDEGRLMFKGILKDNLVTTNKEEQEIIGFFRKMSLANRKIFVLNAEWILNNSLKSGNRNREKKISRKEEKDKTADKLKNLAKSIKKITVLG